MFRPSQKQLTIFTKWQGTDDNILINAVAGSGKTTTLLKLLELCTLRTLFLAFNKSVQTEIQAKIDERGLVQGKAMTMHSMGLMAIRNAYKCKVNSGKNYDLLKQVKANNKDKFRLPWEEQLRLGYALMDMNDVSRIFLTNDIETIQTHLISMDKPIYKIEDIQELWEDFLNCREESYNQNKVEIDFIDMIYLPVYKNLHIPIEPFYLMIDECQDLNLCQHKLIDNLINQGTVKKWIAVGDRNQAIYGFSGAYSSSFDKFLDKGDVIELPLDICYRCSTSIIDEANEVYNVMHYSSPETGIVDYVNDVSYVKENSMVICRNTKPLIDLYFKLLGEDKAAYISGDDILGSIMRFITPYHKNTTLGAKMEMLNKMEDMSKDDSERGRMNLYRFKQDYANYKLLFENLCTGYETVAVLKDSIKKLFETKKDAVMLCTIHKAKGLEADVVYILNEKLIPSKFAKSPEQLKQEQNLKYVARSRAKKELYYLDL